MLQKLRYKHQMTSFMVYLDNFKMELTVKTYQIYFYQAQLSGIGKPMLNRVTYSIPEFLEQGPDVKGKYKQMQHYLDKLKTF